MRAKIIDGRIVFAPRKIERQIDGEDYITYNPTDGILTELGWLPLIYTNIPDNIPEGYHYEDTYTEQNNKIIQNWELVKNLEISDEISDTEALMIIMGGGI